MKEWGSVIHRIDSMDKSEHEYAVGDAPSQAQAQAHVARWQALTSTTSNNSADVDDEGLEDAVYSMRKVVSPLEDVLKGTNLLVCANCRAHSAALRKCAACEQTMCVVLWRVPSLRFILMAVFFDDLADQVL